MIDERILENFKNPDVIYRSAPFWSWNEKLDIEQLKYQIDKMEEGGFGGGFMHSRIGLITPYLSEEWMKCIKEVVEYAKQKGIKAYLYDEDRWPSGFAGGIVTRKKENRIKVLKVWKKGRKWMKKVVNGVNSAWYNGSTYIDSMNEKVVNEFIKSTYEKYTSELNEYIPDVVPAIFTDEPNYFHGRCRRKNNEKEKIYYFPWTKNFREIFKKKYGYDIYEKLEYLIEEKDGFEKIRYDYSRLITELFVKNFGENIYNFCEKNKISLTGHYLSEDSLKGQLEQIGDAMSLYEYMQWPGVDHLGRNINNPLTLKQCSSVGNQLGKERILSELYGCSGQNFTLAERKWIGDWHISLGINFFCPHLYLYSLKGCRKRDYPPTISHHQPYWKYQREIEDYFARLNFIMGQGKFIANILVIHPIETGWALKGSKNLEIYDKYLAEITQKLLENRFEYEFGCENLIEKYGTVEDNKFKIGRGEYEYIIIPPSITLRKRTVELIKKFILNGGKVFASENFPYLIEGEKGEIDFKNDCIFYSSVSSLIDTLKNHVKREIEIKGKDNKDISEIFIHRRKINEDLEVIFLNNISLTNSYEVEIILKYEGKVFKMNPFTGEIKEKFIARKEKDGMVIKEKFPPVGSCLFIVDKSEKPEIEKDQNLEAEEKIRNIEFDIEVNSENILVIDYCRYKKGKNRKWSYKMPCLQIQEILEKESKKQKISLLYEFENENFFEEIYLVAEEIERFNLKINGKILKKEKIERWIDPSFGKIKIKKEFLKKGKNKIEMEFVFVPPRKKNTLIFRKYGTEIEAIYLLGDFKVNSKKIECKDGGYYLNKFSISILNKKISSEDLNIQGFPFYAGSITGRTKVNLEGKNRISLKFEEFKCIVAKIKVNEKEAGIVYLPPYEIEITDYLKEGENLIEIECFSSLRNLLGPHHLKDHNPEFVGPFSFVDWGEKWFKGKEKTSDYSTIPFGIGKVVLIERR